MIDGIDIADLPPRLAELADVIGLAATLRLVEARGGTRIYVPATIAADHWLARLIGIKRARLLADHVADRITTARGVGDYLDIDRAAPALRAVRDRAIVAAFEAGTPAMRIALDFNLTERRVWQILASAGKLSADQSDLFATG